jgi:hypothetical protein
MTICCTHEFKKVYDKLVKKNSHADLEQAIIDWLFGRTVDELRAATVLNGSSPNPFLKKRLNGSGGYRLYYSLIASKKLVISSALHPKTNFMGKSTLSSAEITAAIEDVANSFTSCNLFELTVVKSKLVFNLVNAGHSIFQ